VHPDEDDKQGFGRSFHHLWGATGLTAVGSAFNDLALPLIALVTFEVSPLTLALLIALEMVWWPLLGLPAGVWVDRWKRRNVLFTSYILRAALIATIPLAALADALTLPQLFVVAGVTGAVGVFESLAERAVVPTVVATDNLVRANSRLAATNTSVEVGGTGVAGLIIEATTATFAFAIEAALAAGAAIASLGITEPAPPSRPAERSFRKEVREGAAWALRPGLFRTTTIVNTVWNFSVAAQYVLVFLFLSGPLDLGPLAIGLLLTVPSVGSITGSIMSDRLQRKYGSGPIWRTARLVGAISALLLPLATRGAGLAFFIISAFVFAATSTTAAIVSGSIRQSLCPPELLGRVSATSRVISWGTIPLGALAAGAVAEVVGSRTALFFFAALFLAAPAFIYRSPLRATYDLSTVDENLQA